ncbi:MAG TPA: FMN-binding protein [Acidothermaceae bacterium]
MRRFVAVFVATVAGLVVLLSFKETPTKAPRPLALAGPTAGGSSDPASPGAVSSDPPTSSAAVGSVFSSAPATSAAATSTAAPSTSRSAATPSAKKASPTPTKSSAKPTPNPTPKPSPTPSSATKTVTGSSVTVSEGRRVFGAVQVRLTLTNGKITAATAINYPNNDSRSSQISSFSIPILSQEVLQAQGSSIAVVSGATYTSNAYAQSVQAALDAAKA